MAPRPTATFLFCRMAASVPVADEKQVLQARKRVKHRLAELRGGGGRITLIEDRAVVRAMVEDNARRR